MLTLAGGNLIEDNGKCGANGGGFCRHSVDPVVVGGVHERGHHFGGAGFAFRRPCVSTDEPDVEVRFDADHARHVEHDIFDRNGIGFATNFSVEEHIETFGHNMDSWEIKRLYDRPKRGAHLVGQVLIGNVTGGINMFGLFDNRERDSVGDRNDAMGVRLVFVVCGLDAALFGLMGITCFSFRRCSSRMNRPGCHRQCQWSANL